MTYNPQTRDRDFLKLLAIPKEIDCIIQTSDRYILGHLVGDCGYNQFLGQPRFVPGPGQDYRREVWSKFSLSCKKRVVRLSRLFGWPIREML